MVCKPPKIKKKKNIAGKINVLSTTGFARDISNVEFSLKLKKMPSAAEQMTNGHCTNVENKTEGAGGGKKDFSLFCDERGYLNIVEYILQHGARKGDRTGTGVISVFGTQARYSLRGETNMQITVSSTVHGS